MGRGKTLEWWDEWAPRQKAADGRPAPHGKSLEIEAMRAGRDERFGKYAAAIARQEAAFGHPAPPPTEPTGKTGHTACRPGSWSGCKVANPAG